MHMKIAFALVTTFIFCHAEEITFPLTVESRNKNLLVNPGFELNHEGKASGWNLMDKGYTPLNHGRNESRAIQLHSNSNVETHGIEQSIVFRHPIQHPIKLSAWFKTSGIEGVECSAYMVFFCGETSQWGNVMQLPRLSCDWTYLEKVFTPEKPIKRLMLCIATQKAKGTILIDDVSVSLAPHSIAKGNLWAGISGEGRLDGELASNIPSKWDITILENENPIRKFGGSGTQQMISWDGTNNEGKSLPPGKYQLQVRATDDIFGQVASLDREIDTRSHQQNQNYFLWTKDSMTRVLSNDLPDSDHPNQNIKLSAACNESESAQILIRPRPGSKLHNVRLTTSDLISNNAKISAQHLSWHQVGYVKITEQAKEHPHLRKSINGWLPDVLLPVKNFHVDDHWTQPVWVTVRVPKDTAPGKYNGTITIHADQNSDVAVPIELEVYPFTLPDEGHLKNTFALMQGYLEKLYGKENVTAELRKKYGDFLMDHRLNPDDITRTDLPYIEDLVHYNKRGMNTFNVLNMVEPRNGEWNCFSPVSFYTPAFKQSLIEKLDPYVAEIKKLGFDKKAYIHGFDERPEEYYPIMREYFGMAKERYGLPTLTTGKIAQDPKVMRDLNVDWLCPLTDLYSFEDAERCRAEGLQVWSYVCLGPRFPYANFLADDPLIEARIIMWQAFHQKFDGFLYWGVNVWWHKNTEQVIDPAKGPLLNWSITTNGMNFLHGDGVLIYPLADGPAGSIRLSNLRDGLEDYELLWALGNKRGNVWSARSDCEPVTTSLTTFTRSPECVYETRKKILDQLTR